MRGAPDFGQVTSYDPPWRMQMGMRMTFYVLALPVPHLCEMRGGRGLEIQILIRCRKACWTRLKLRPRRVAATMVRLARGSLMRM